MSAFTGTPYRVSASGTSLNTPSNAQNADFVGEYNILGNVGNAGKWFDTSAFDQPTGVRFGNSGRNQFYGPGAWTADLVAQWESPDQRFVAELKAWNIFDERFEVMPQIEGWGRTVEASLKIRF